MSIEADEAPPQRLPRVGNVSVVDPISTAIYIHNAIGFRGLLTMDPSGSCTRCSILLFRITLASAIGGLSSLACVDRK